MNTEDRILVAGETFEAIARELLGENKRLLARVKELEHCRDNYASRLNEMKSELDKSLKDQSRAWECHEHAMNRESELKSQLHQRDTALVKARECLLHECVFLEDYLRHHTHPGVSRLVSDNRESRAHIDHDLSKIQAVKP